MLSLLTQHERIYFLDVAQLKDLLHQIQAKIRNYRNRHVIDKFLPLAIEVFGCLHKHVDVFLHDCANAI
jgi:hypothetical protein